MESRTRALPKSRSNTRISVLTGTQKKSPAKATNESTRLYHLASGGGGDNRGAAGGRLRALGRNAPLGGGGGGGGGGGSGGGYGSYQPLRASTNPVEDCLRAGAAGLGWCLLCWFAGVVLLVFEYARRWGAHRGSRGQQHGGDDGPQWLVFSPFWVGDALALLVLVRIMAKVTNVRFATPARSRGGRRSDGRVRSTGSLTELSSHGANGRSAAAGGGGGGGPSYTPIALEYFPLLQRVVASALGAFLLLLIFTAQQVLVCLRWGREADAPGALRPLVVVAPLLIVEVFFLLRVAIIRTHGWISGLTWMLLLLLTVSVAVRSDVNSDHEATTALRSLPWLECLAPLWLLDLLYAGVAGYVAANTVAGRFVMAPTQGLCFALLVAALAGSTVAEMLLTGDHRLHKLSAKVPRVEYLRLDLPLLLVVLSLMAFNLAVFLSAEHSVSMLINTHGYDDPLPLCETPSGWEWSGAGKAAWGLLGDVSVRAEKKVGLPAGLSGGKGISAASTSDMYSAESGFADKYERSDSGQYTDIYDNLNDE